MLVLWLIVVLGVIAAGVVALARSQTNIATTIRSRSVARYAAESGVAAATVRLKEMVRSARTLDEKVRAFQHFEEELVNWGERSLGSGRYRVVATDLNARVDLNNSAEAVKLGLFEQFFGGNEAVALVNALEDWVDEDDEPLPDGAEAADYRRAGSPFLPPNGPIQRLDELTRIRGFSDSIAGVIAPYVTVWSDGRVNVNSAPLAVLAVAPELGASGAELMIAARERGDVLASKIVVSSRLREAGNFGGGQLRNLTTVPGYILIVSRGWEEGHPLTHEIQAVFQVHGLRVEDGPRLQVRYWTERDL
jgi:general secretion pathway protein K